IPGLPGDGFNGPLAIGIGPGGEVYVGDIGFQRIEKFEPDGTFVAAWGEGVVTGSPGTYETCTVPTDCRQGQHTGTRGSFGNTVALATDSQGNVYVAADDRITKFGSDGHFVAVWGKDVDTGGGTGFEICTVSASCKSAATGTLGGELFGAAGIGIDATDHV